MTSTPKLILYPANLESSAPKTFLQAFIEGQAVFGDCTSAYLKRPLRTEAEVRKDRENKGEASS